MESNTFENGPLFSSALDRFDTAFYRAYRGSLTLAVKHPLISIVVVIALFVGAVQGLGFVPNQFMPKSDSARLIAELDFDQSFSFIYSARPGTPAANLPDDLPPIIANGPDPFVTIASLTGVRDNLVRFEGEAPLAGVKVFLGVSLIVLLAVIVVSRWRKPEILWTPVTMILYLLGFAGSFALAAALGFLGGVILYGF